MGQAGEKGILEENRTIMGSIIAEGNERCLFFVDFLIYFNVLHKNVVPG